jgi:threonine synthase
VLALPYGGGGNTLAYAAVRRERRRHPRLLGAVGASAPTTVGSAIRIVEPVHREQVGGVAEVVTVADERAARVVAGDRAAGGLFCEPASAAGVAGVAQVRPGGRVVCVLTGHGLKDPDAVERL